MTSFIKLEGLLPEGLSESKFHQYLEELEGLDAATSALKLSGISADWRSVITSQLEGRRIAVEKFPSLAENPAVFFPVKISLEQASSETTADYKASLCSGKSCLDATAGFGVDSRAFAKHFDHVTAIEDNEQLVRIGKYNSQALLQNNIEWIKGDGMDFVKNTDQHFDLIYADPSRREGNTRVSDFSLAVPDPAAFVKEALKKSSNVLIKCPPMSDINALIELMGQPDHIHVVSVHDECKEILFHWSNQNDKTLVFTAIDFGRHIHKFQFTRNDEEKADISRGPLKEFVYLPMTAIVKAGAFNAVAAAFGLTKISGNTHVYSSSEIRSDFPGKIYEVLGVIPYQYKKLRDRFPDSGFVLMKRNFPDSISAIAKKLKIRDYGSKILLAYRNESNVPEIAVLKRIPEN